MLELPAQSTALVVIDLQKGIVGRPMVPHSGPEVVKTCADLAQRFREAGAPVVWVRVAWAKDFGDAPKAPVDAPFQAPPGGFPPDWLEMTEGLAEDSDLHVIKRHWGAFHGTDLDLQLRRRGITTIVLAGIATNFGVESTARAAWELSYAVVTVEDAMASTSVELHDFSIAHILPRLSRVRKAAEIVLEPAVAAK
jgi:nicotinamidase-related amidase